LLPPAVSYEAEDKQRHGGQVKNAPVEGFGRALAHLLGRSGADRALRLDGRRAMQDKQEDEYE